MDTAKLFKNGEGRAVRLPKEYRFDGKVVYIKRLGHDVLLIPKPDPWESLVLSLDLFTDDFMAEGSQPETENHA